jgi:hypothetical protein
MGQGTITLPLISTIHGSNFMADPIHMGFLHQAHIGNFADENFEQMQLQMAMDQSLQSMQANQQN